MVLSLPSSEDGANMQLELQLEGLRAASLLGPELKHFAVEAQPSRTRSNLQTLLRSPRHTLIKFARACHQVRTDDAHVNQHRMYHVCWHFPSP